MALMWLCPNYLTVWIFYVSAENVPRKHTPTLTRDYSKRTGAKTMCICLCTSVRRKQETYFWNYQPVWFWGLGAIKTCFVMYKTIFHDKLYMYIWFSNNASNLDYKLKIRSTIPGEWGRVAATIHKLHQMTKKSWSLSDDLHKSES